MFRMRTLVLVLFLTVSAGPSVRPALAQGSVAPLEMVVIGDSIPFAGFCTTCDRAFVSDFADRLLTELGVATNVSNRSRNDGAVLDQINDQVANETRLREQLSTASIVIISAGFNDTLWRTPEYPCGAEDVPTRELIEQFIDSEKTCLAESPLAFEDDYRRLYAEVRALVPEEAVVMVVNVYNAWTGWPDFDVAGTAEELTVVTDHISHYLDHWNAMECRLAMESGFICIDVYHAFNGPAGSDAAGDLLEEDYVHPSAKGNALIADLLMAAWLGR